MAKTSGTIRRKSFLLQEKRAIYLERLYVLQQRLARNPLFSRPVFGDLSERGFVEVRLSDSTEFVLCIWTSIFST